MIPTQKQRKTIDMVKYYNRIANNDIVKIQAIIKPGKEYMDRGTVWTYITGDTKDKLKYLHPSPFSDNLARDCVICFCPPKGIVLAPFMGSGTTAIACLELDRHFIGFDISKEYCDLANKRIENRKVKMPLFQKAE